MYGARRYYQCHPRRTERYVPSVRGREDRVLRKADGGWDVLVQRFISDTPARSPGPGTEPETPSRVQRLLTWAPVLQPGRGPSAGVRRRLLLLPVRRGLVCLPPHPDAGTAANTRTPADTGTASDAAAAYAGSGSVRRAVHAAQRPHLPQELPMRHGRGAVHLPPSGSAIQARRDGALTPPRDDTCGGAPVAQPATCGVVLRTDATARRPRGRSLVPCHPGAAPTALCSVSAHCPSPAAPHRDPMGAARGGRWKVPIVGRGAPPFAHNPASQVA